MEMLYELEDTSQAEKLFAGWNETLIFSCLQKVMGKIYVTDLEQPRSAFAFVGCFGFYAGVPDREMVMSKPGGYTILPSFRMTIPLPRRKYLSLLPKAETKSSVAGVSRHRS